MDPAVSGTVPGEVDVWHEEETDGEGDAQAETSERLDVRRHLLGMLALGTVVTIWVGSSTLMQYVYNENFSKPFFLTYVSTSLFSVYLVGFAAPSWRRDRSVGRLWRRAVPVWLGGDPAYRGGLLRAWVEAWHGEARPRGDGAAAVDDVFGDTASLLLAGAPATGGNAERDLETVHLVDSEGRPAQGADGTEDPPPMFTTVRVATIGLVVAFMWLFANYTFSLSLALTSVSSTTIISSVSGLFVLLLGVLAGVDTFSLFKLLAVLLCMGGVTLVALSDHQKSGDEELKGDIIAFVSAFGYGVYVVYLKREIHDEKRVRMPMVFAFVGLFGMTLTWPLFFLLNWMGTEPFELPSSHVWLYIVINALVGTVVSDLVWLWAVVLTTPLIATIGLSMTIPVAMLSDYLFRGRTNLGWMYLGGSLLVVLGFVLINTVAELQDCCRRRRRPSSDRGEVQ